MPKRPTPGGRKRSGPRGAGPRASDLAATREQLAKDREARKAQRRAAAETRRRVEAEEQERRKKTWKHPRLPIEPSIYGPDEEHRPFRAGWVALLGRPNVGKSTLLNALLGQKLAATTHKPQTTRKNLLGVLNPPEAQLLLLDTPGHHQAEGPLNRFMVAQAEEAVREADVVAYVVEARADGQITPGNERLLGVLEAADKPVVAVLNKVDLVRRKTGMLHFIAEIEGRLGDRLRGLVPISARTGAGLEALVRELARALPESEPLVDEDEVTNQSEREIVGEFIREKAMIELQEELPYSVAVTVDRFEDLRPKLARIIATLHVERPSQKGIVIGRQGSRLRSIGSRARKDIEFLLGTKVFLDLTVRVSGSWSQDRGRLRELGYDDSPPVGPDLSDLGLLDDEVDRSMGDEEKP